MESRGVIYVATGERFVDEAIQSAVSVKEQMPELPITLFTDLQGLVGFPPDPIDTVMVLENVDRSCRDKIWPLKDSPYDKTLFLDTDTFVCRRLDELFVILDRYDIAAAHAPNRYQYHLPEIPDCFAELNSGVIVYRRNDATRDLFTAWEKTFMAMLEKDKGSYRDQHSLRDALYRSTARFFVLPPEYNFRTIGPNFAGKNCPVKIVHGRHADIRRVAARVNASNDSRVFLVHPFRKWTGELGTYETFPEAVMNIVFQSLPTGLKSFLSDLRARLNRR